MAARAKQELGQKQGVPKQELGNEPFMFQGNTQDHENVEPPPSTVL